MESSTPMDVDVHTLGCDSRGSYDASHSCPEDASVNEAILKELPKRYKEFTILMLSSAITTSKQYYDEYATSNNRTPSSCSEQDFVIELLQKMGEGTRKELHGLVLQHKFAAFVYHGKFFMSTLASKLTKPIESLVERWGSIDAETVRRF
jgi:hypothetical protein